MSITTTTNGTLVEDLYDTPMCQSIMGRQDAGENVWIAGFNPKGTHVLVAWGDRDMLTVAHVQDCNRSVGRYENRMSELALVAQRFPLR